MLAADAEVQVRTTKPFGESTMSRILDMVQNASERKSPTELFIRKFSGVYTMFAMLMAASIILLPLLASLAGWIDVYDWHKWLSRAAVFMVIACPCIGGEYSIGLFWRYRHRLPTWNSGERWQLS